ncbi:hypothetical protein A5752_02055 [Mycobacterium sp. 852002-51961_SCH5331710]|nr:hypothetical protein A5752_02055 [Mycobacterium sp. 852002-51961_SCH5331710]
MAVIEITPEFDNEGGQLVCAVRISTAVVSTPLKTFGEICVCSFTLCGSPPPESTIPVVTMDDACQTGNSFPGSAGNAAFIS